MKASRFADMLLGAGVVVGIAAVAGLVLGFEPASLPPALLNIAAYKLTFVGAAGLLAGGAFLRRYARRDERSHDEMGKAMQGGAAKASLPLPGLDPSPGPAARDPETVQRQSERVDTPR